MHKVRITLKFDNMESYQGVARLAEMSNLSLDQFVNMCVEMQTIQILTRAKEILEKKEETTQ